MPDLQINDTTRAATTSVAQAAPSVVERAAQPFEFVERHARLWEAKEYPEYGLTADADYIDQLIFASKTLDRIPLEIAMLTGDPSAPHGTSDDRIDVGDVLPSSLYRDGKWLCGKVRLPKVIDDRLDAPTKRKLSVQFNPKTFRLTHTAIVPRERCKGASFSETEFSFAEAGDVEPEKKPEPPVTEAKPSVEQPPQEEQQATAGSMAKVLEILTGLGLKLPEDTTEKNLRERIEVAGDAVLNSQQPDPNDSPNLNKEVRQPQPIAMSQTSEETMSTETKPVVAPDFSFSHLDKTPEVDIPFAQRQFIRNQYRAMVEALVKTRRITGQYADKWLLPLFGKSAQEFSFSVVTTEKGPVAQHQMLDYLLAAFADVPEGAILNGPVAVVDKYGRGGKKKKGAGPDENISFALHIPEEAAEASGEEGGEVLNFAGEPTADQKKVTEEMTAMALRHIPGGTGKLLQTKVM